MTEPRPCRRCGEPIPATRRSNARFCTHACTVAYDRERRARRFRAAKRGRTCVWCGTPIAVERRATAIACSRECVVAHGHARDKAERRDARSGRSCRTCGEPLPSTKRSGARYCSPRCAQRARSRRRELVPADPVAIAPLAGEPVAANVAPAACSSAVMVAALARLGLDGHALPIAEVATTLALAFRWLHPSDDDLFVCDICGGSSPESEPACPFCGDETPVRVEGLNGDLCGDD